MLHLTYQARAKAFRRRRRRRLSPRSRICQLCHIGKSQIKGTDKGKSVATHHATFLHRILVHKVLHSAQTYACRREWREVFHYQARRRCLSLIYMSPRQEFVGQEGAAEILIGVAPFLAISFQR